MFAAAEVSAAARAEHLLGVLLTSECALFPPAARQTMVSRLLLALDMLPDLPQGFEPKPHEQVRPLSVLLSQDERRVNVRCAWFDQLDNAMGFALEGLTPSQTCKQASEW
jgi:hypothetical protein